MHITPALATVVSFLLVTASSGPAAALAAQSGELIEPGAGTWPTWLLTSGDELRLGPPPDASETQAELGQLQELAQQRDRATLDRISYWDASAPSYRWTQRAIKHTQARAVVGNRAIRMLALTTVAIDDATVAAWNSKYTHNRPRPGTALLGLASIPSPASPSNPDEHAVAAGAANLTASFWEYYGGRAAFEFWNDHASRAIFDHHMNDDPPRAARIYASTHVALHDVLVACFDASTPTGRHDRRCSTRPSRPCSSRPTTRAIRPRTRASRARSAPCWASISPNNADNFRSLANQASEARIMGGIHYRTDLEARLALGHQVADAILSRTEVGGAQAP
jgi:hypothetical protein